jgi:N-acetylmuramoyl-L-alanine amidase
MRWFLQLTLVMLVAAAVATEAAATPRVRYGQALERETTVRAQLETRPLTAEAIAAARRLARNYEQVTRLFPTSGYSDNALWQAGRLLADLYALTNDDDDRKRALRYLQSLVREYPSSSLVAQAGLEVDRLERAAAPVPPAAPARAAASGARPARQAADASTTAPRPSSKAPAPPRAGPTAATPPGATAAPAAAPVDPAPLPAVRPAEPPVIRVPEPTSVAVRDIPEPLDPPARSDAEPAQVRSIVRTAMESFVRVTIELDREVSFKHERLANPDRVFVDFAPARLALGSEKSQRFTSGAVRQIRTGEQSNQSARVVLDIEGVTAYSVFALYDPFRLVVDCETTEAPARAIETTAAPPQPPPVPVEPGPGAPATVLAAAGRPPVTTPPPAPSEPVDHHGPGASAPVLTPAAAAARASAEAAASGEPAEAGGSPTKADSPLPSRRSAAPAAPQQPAPGPIGPPSANLRGRFSLSRQLGLGISRIVIDPGHGGHDPGAIANGVTEAELVLDIALRLEQLLLKQPGVEVVLTRRTNVFVSLEERTAIANREDADLFLSIHANASRNRQARGVETYFLNFASNPQAEAVAARENAGSSRTMRNLPDIVKAIAMNDKLDESRDFATMVQRAMVARLRTANKEVRDLGVKQAPFVVLIGAGMPSVLAEVSFVTHPQEARLLKSNAYKQRIAEALFDGIQRYQRSLKTQRAVAAQ